MFLVKFGHDIRLLWPLGCVKRPARLTKQCEHFALTTSFDLRAENIDPKSQNLHQREFLCGPTHPQVLCFCSAGSGSRQVRVLKDKLEILTSWRYNLTRMEHVLLTYQSIRLGELKILALFPILYFVVVVRDWFWYSLPFLSNIPCFGVTSISTVTFDQMYHFSEYPWEYIHKNMGSSRRAEKVKPRIYDVPSYLHGKTKALKKQGKSVLLP